MAWIRNRGQKNNGRGPDAARSRSKPSRARSSDPTYWPDFGFIPPPATPLPLNAAMRQLPQQYRRVVTKPYAETFLAEMGQASWGIVWVQLLGYALIAALLGFLATLISPSQTNNTSSASGLSSPVVIRAITLSSSLGLFILIPVLFFVVMGILFLLIRAFGGQGRFLQQSYTTLLFLVPFGVAVSVLGVIPFAGGFFSAFLGAIAFLYSIVLQIFATMAVHRLTGGKATAAVVITAILLIPLTLALFALWTFIILAIVH